MLQKRDALSTGRIDHPWPPAMPSGAARVRPPRTLWYALYFPALTDPDLLSELASACQSASAHVCTSPPDVLVLEVRSMLRYFGNMNTLKMRLMSELQTRLQNRGQQLAFFDALSPSADASALLARSGLQTQIQSTDALRSALAPVPVLSLPLDKKLVQRLTRCGLHHLRDIWRLPTSALRLRFGRTLSEYLALLLAQRPSTFARWQPALMFSEDIRVEEELSNRDDLGWLVLQLLKRMKIFLERRQLATDQLIFSLYKHRSLISTVILNTRHPTSNIGLWRMLFENRLEIIRLPDVITGIELKVMQFYPVMPAGACPAAQKADHKPETGLLEMLASRLGREQIYQLHNQQCHDPAVAGQYLVFGDPQSSTPETCQANPPGFGDWKEAPCWLLSSPRRLGTCNEKPVYLSILEFAHGPRRIETCWWTGHDIRRDYYIARNCHGMMLWIYRDLAQEKSDCKKPSRWFLHGLFA